MTKNAGRIVRSSLAIDADRQVQGRERSTSCTDRMHAWASATAGIGGRRTAESEHADPAICSAACITKSGNAGKGADPPALDASLLPSLPPCPYTPAALTGGLGGAFSPEPATPEKRPLAHPSTPWALPLPPRP
jgi:hypothetical protein